MKQIVAVTFHLQPATRKDSKKVEATKVKSRENTKPSMSTSQCLDVERQAGRPRRMNSVEGILGDIPRELSANGRVSMPNSTKEK